MLRMRIQSVWWLVLMALLVSGCSLAGSVTYRYIPPSPEDPILRFLSGLEKAVKEGDAYKVSQHFAEPSYLITSQGRSNQWTRREVYNIVHWIVEDKTIFVYKFENIRITPDAYGATVEFYVRTKHRDSLGFWYERYNRASIRLERVGRSFLITERTIDLFSF